jgi:hypothetical protein
LNFRQPNVTAIPLANNLVLLPITPIKKRKAVGMVVIGTEPEPTAIALLAIIGIGIVQVEAAAGVGERQDNIGENK